MIRSLAVAVSLLALAQPALAQTTAPADEGARLKKLFADSDEAQLKRNPIGALFRGDMRYADRLGDYCSDAYFAAEKAAGEADLGSLGGIDRAKLNATDQIAYDVFKYQTEQGLRGFGPDIFPLTVVRPINHFTGAHVFYPVLASGTSAAPFKTIADYENNLKRHKEFVTILDCATGRFREGMAAGVFDTKLTIENVIGQLDTQLAAQPEDSPYFAPAKNFPADFSAADKARLTTAYRAAVTEELFPAYRRLRDFLKNEYLPRARTTMGLSGMKGGDRYYEFMIQDQTTLPLKAEEVHQLGLKEVARIRAGMEAIKNEVGFQGTLAEFFNHLRTDPKFKPASRDALRDGYYAIGKRVDARIREQFSTIPKTPLEIRAVEPFREKNASGGSYSSGAPDGSRPGIFYYNAYDLPSRTTPGMETLYLHEGSPGHHFQISLAQENDALPAFMRFGGNTAFVEGWALYAETLGPELGMFTDPYARFGHLDDEMLRAMRLVVDTGIHAKGWGRDQAIEYMLSNSGMGKTDATSEVERYIANPGQALAYKIGALTIQRLRKKAEDKLGDRFDPRAFHAQVLMTGALPMTVLEAKIDAWIAAGGA